MTAAKLFLPLFPEGYKIQKLAGLLTHPVLFAFPSHNVRKSGLLKKTLNRFTAAGTVPDSHRIPF